MQRIWVVECRNKGLVEEDSWSVYSTFTQKHDADRDQREAVETYGKSEDFRVVTYGPQVGNQHDMAL